jgi:uncharacterized protein (TIGR02996 family)
VLEELLAGIVSDPEEDRYAVVADWLEEHDDPRRAELLRLHRRMLAACCEPDRHPERGDWHARIVQLIAAGVRPCVPQKKLVLASGVEMTFSFVPPGGYLMGSPPGEKWRGAAEEQRRVYLTGGIWMGVVPVTQAQWSAVMGYYNPSKFKGEDHPVESATFFDHLGFCKRLTERFGWRFRLPTGVEWEWGCRAGTTTAFHTGDGQEAMRRAGWCDYDHRSPLHWGVGTMPVGQFLPNAFGLFDMHGGVEELTSDQAEGGFRVLRGGSWASVPECCRSAARRPWLGQVMGSVVGCRVCLDAG